MQNIIDISIDNPKQQIRLNGDDSKIIELDLSDSAILNRFNDGIGAIQKLLTSRDTIRQEIADFDNALSEEDTEKSFEEFDKLVKAFAATEEEMRSIINTIFDYDVCTPIAGKTSIFTVKNGTPLYETIIDTLVDLYGKTIQEEHQKMKSRLNKHAGKYMKK